MSYKIKHNIAASFKAICDTLGQPPHNRLHAMLIFDKVLIETCVYWDDKTNKFLGVCHKHGYDTSLEFTSKEDLQAL